MTTLEEANNLLEPREDAKRAREALKELLAVGGKRWSDLKKDQSCTTNDVVVNWVTIMVVKQV